MTLEEELADLIYELAKSCKGNGIGWACKPEGYDERKKERELNG